MAKSKKYKKNKHKSKNNIPLPHVLPESLPKANAEMPADPSNPPNDFFSGIFGIGKRFMGLKEKGLSLYKKTNSIVIEDEILKFYKKLDTISASFRNQRKPDPIDFTRDADPALVADEGSKSMRKLSKGKVPKKIAKSKAGRPAKSPKIANAVKYVTDEQLRAWSVDGYVDSKSGLRIYGKDVLLRALFSSSFWTSFSQYVDALNESDRVQIGGMIPKSLGSFSPRIKHAGFETNNPKNMCLWLGALDSDRASFCDEHGWLTAEGLKNWFAVGYVDPADGKRVLGRDILKEFYVSQNFWEEISKYANSLSGETLRVIGGKFPNWVSTFASTIKGSGQKKISIDEILEWLGAEKGEFSTTNNSKGYLSVEGLRKWCTEGYFDPAANRQIYGKDVLLQCLYSPSFWKSLSEYSNGLDAPCIERIGGMVSSNSTAYAPKMKESGYENFNVRDLCVWLGAIDASEAKYTDEFGNLSTMGLKRWYAQGYINPITGNRITGREILAYAKGADN